MDLDVFLSLPTAEVAEIVREKGPRVCVFPINGTRRWFLLEHGTAVTSQTAYVRLTWEAHLALYQLFFEHGIHTLVTPIFGPELLERGEAYRAMIDEGLDWFVKDATFREFYKEMGVRVRVYGDAERYMRPAYENKLASFAKITAETQAYDQHRLFFGVCAHDATETVAAFGAKFMEEHGRLPNKREIVTHYYGEYVPPADLFIGFDKPAVFDMPLLNNGREDLYFTVAPSLYLDAKTLRLILYDHLYSRNVDESYTTLSPQVLGELRAFYNNNKHQVLGVGAVHEHGRFWQPTLYQCT